MLTRYTVAEESGEEAGACLGIEQVLARHRLIEAGGGRVSEDYPFNGYALLVAIMGI